MDAFIALIYMLLGGLIVLLVVILFLEKGKGQNINLSDTILVPDELEKHAAEVARHHTAGRNARSLKWLLRRTNDNFEYISAVYKELNQDVKLRFPTAPAAEWLLDNFYIIEEQAKLIRKNLPKGYYGRLPVLKNGYLRGYPRVYAIALELVSHTDGRIDEKALTGFLNAYQSQCMLSMGELWAIALMLRIALLENVRNICEKIMDSQKEWHLAEKISEYITETERNDYEITEYLKEQLKSVSDIGISFTEHFLQRLRKAGRGIAAATSYLDGRLSEENTSTTKLAAAEHHMQASRQVSIGNTITGLRLISEIDWSDIFESLNQVEAVLRQDPAGVYTTMDFASRDMYRHEVEKLSRIFSTSEINVARIAVECAKEAGNRGDCPAAEKHVGFYLIREGRKCLVAKLGSSNAGRRHLVNVLGRYPILPYTGVVTLITLFITAYFAYYSSMAQSRASYILTVLTAIIVLIPASELSLIFINSILSHVVKPSMLPKLELKQGIPGEYGTFVIIPTLLPNEKRVHELLKQIELLYLGNRESNLYFALVGDFKDSGSSQAEGDKEIVNAALSGIKELNLRYSDGKRDLFFYLHRSRQFNERQGRWMGWERKRGAINEFNRLLRGAGDTGFAIASGDVQGAGPIKYVITLDADTNLPIGAAKRLIGTIAHPLNSAVFNKDSSTVTSGYGLLQPRISVTVQAANSTLFTRIFAGQGGIDPYTTAVSDIYQDLFGEGIFTGKGIYDVDVFLKALEGKIPDNTVLSHDLLEGCHVRAGLVTDIELIDGYPARYNSFAMRQHRWVRGDWQLLPWLASSVRGKSGEKYKNTLSIVSKWKIIENLRRSLVNPSIFLLFILGAGILPGSHAVWITFAIITAASPILSYIFNALLSGNGNTLYVKRKSTIITGFRASLYQSIILLAFIPYQAYLMADAIIRTLARVLFTKKNLLEWVTAADMEASLKNDLASFWRRMWISAPAALVIISFELFFRPSPAAYLPQSVLSAMEAALLAVLWLSAPYIAYRISEPYRKAVKNLTAAETAKLRELARKTWRYFEDFAVKEDNYMPPDNYQEEPPKGVAHRTSPTNIGLLLASVISARDLGYTGVFETVEKLDFIISGIEKMEKWKGHLYNWYNTITLDTMRPLYVSTVDSGNYAGYMMALRHGLAELADKGPAGINLADGLRDTLNLFTEEEKQNGRSFVFNGLDDIAKDGKMQLDTWYEALLSLHDNLEKLKPDGLLENSYWGGKLYNMTAEYLEELDVFYPWITRRDISSNEKASVIAAGVNSETGLRALSRAYAAAGCPGAGSGDSAIDAAGSDAAEQERILNNSAARIKSLLAGIEKLIGRIDALLSAMEFAPLFDNKRQLFSIGFNVEDGHLSKSYYDLLASEARQTSYIAIARGEVDQKHWFRLGRRLTSSDGCRGLVSWTGTIFEYLMPPLLMKSFENTLLDETYQFVTSVQKRYMSGKGMPWGISESGYMAFDINLNYQYKAFGIPELGLKRGLGNDMVVAPYASVLAVAIDPQAVSSNIGQLEKLGAYGDYGLYEAVDFTPSRITRDNAYSIVKSYMAHHQGMSLTAINNYVNGNIMQKRFHADPKIMAAELLLQERVPGKSDFTKDHRDESQLPEKKNDQIDGDAVRIFGVPDTLLPQVHLLSNGSYSLMLTSGGSSAGKNGDIAVNRWSRDFRDGSSGTFIFVQNINSNNAWSSTFEPFNTVPDKYRVAFSPDKAEFLRKDGNIETNTEITVSPEDNAEIRRVSFTNHSNFPRILEITSYLEAVLAPAEADNAHPAFSKLFVRTEFVREFECLIASRRHRTEHHKPVWMLHVMSCEGQPVGEIQYETDRMKFIGRNRSISNPLAMEPDQPLSNTAGSVLDPVMSLRRRIKLEPGQTVRVSYTTAVSETRKNILELAEKYSDFKAAERAFELSWTRSQVETRYLGLKKSDIEFYLDLVPFLVFDNPLRENYSSVINENTLSQSGLWPFGISGDLPIMLVSISSRDDLDMVYWALNGHEYWKMRGLNIDLVILVEEESGYQQPVIELVRDAVMAGHGREQLEMRSGIFIRSSSVMNGGQVKLLYTAAWLVVKDGIGALREKVRKVMLPVPAAAEVPEGNAIPAVKAAADGAVIAAGSIVTAGSEAADKAIPEISAANVDTREKYGDSQVNDNCSCDIGVPRYLLFYNGIGGFRQDGREYVVYLRKKSNTPAPWSNVISNESFGFLVTESGGGYVWSGNSRENKLTPWSNDPVADLPGEVLYLRDDKDGSVWNPTPMPLRENEAYVVRHGFGYTSFEHNSHGLQQNLTVFAAEQEPVKLSMLILRNSGKTAKKLTLTYYVRPVLGVDDNQTSMYLTTRPDANRRIMYIENKYSPEFSGKTAFTAVSEQVHTFTGDRGEFMGVNGSLNNPAALKAGTLSEKTGAGIDPCAVLQVKIEILPESEKTLVFLFGQYDNEMLAREAALKFADAERARQELKQVIRHWEDILDRVKVKTPDIAMDFIMNGWLLYQVISCRLLARSAFYQSGGAYGFRDQLQDVMATAYSKPELMKKQILLHASRQFVEGDVQHWWHKEAGRGIRTRYSDDLLWLPYVTSDYIERTGDYEILDIEAGYLESEKLHENEDERYETPSVSAASSSIYEHCTRAIDYSLKYGSHGLPLMGSGDWNDGMNTVGNKGCGESVWLGWFLHKILKKFIPLCNIRNDRKRAKLYEDEAAKIAEAIEAEAWDGSWYKRAYFDDGNALGTVSNQECRIDSIAQSWSVISGAGSRRRSEEAMDAVEKYLVDYDECIIKLLTPPFDEGLLRPGYIRGYVPGVRENGGQYTHAAVWVVLAFAELGMGDKAWELFNMINPVNHSRTPVECSRYKLEPYVLAADVYAVPPNSGRGGWSWYTGAAGWLYRVGLENILGIKREGRRLYVNPCIPSDWDGFEVIYRFENSTYNISVVNPDKAASGIKSIVLDGKPCMGGFVDLVADGTEHRVNVVMGSRLPEVEEIHKEIIQVH